MVFYVTMMKESGTFAVLLMDRQVSGKVLQSEVVVLLTVKRCLKVNVWKGEN